MQRIVFATNNAHKLDEVRHILSGLAQVVSLADIGCHDDIAETADTLEGNALLKAQWVSTHYGVDCFADDTGLEVEALNGAPGVLSARYAGPQHDDNANKRKLLQALNGCNNRAAQFRTAIALIENGEVHHFEGIVKGHIIDEERGTAGFGYDPLFVPEGYTLTFAEMGEQTKNTISHRGRAVRQLADYLKQKHENNHAAQ
ncbi:MAG: non-canonical purine NTP diphosphatase [Bacteroidaceae bacterium]|nr:non-canonical purine NTP diphosphatase [Bacteroidaceae bacterium]